MASHRFHATLISMCCRGSSVLHRRLDSSRFAGFKHKTLSLALLQHCLIAAHIAVLAKGTNGLCITRKTPGPPNAKTCKNVQQQLKGTREGFTYLTSEVLKVYVGWIDGLRVFNISQSHSTQQSIFSACIYNHEWHMVLLSQ